VCDDIFFIRFYVESSPSLKGGGGERRARKEYNDLSARLPRDILTPACAQGSEDFSAHVDLKRACVRVDKCKQIPVVRTKKRANSSTQKV
jgi:hypothetical protein